MAFVVACASSVRAQETQKPAAAEKKLVGAWLLNEGEGLVVKDTSGNAKDGKILKDGRNAKWVEGRNGKAVEFTGGDPTKRNEAGCIEIPNMGDVDFGKGLTVQAWVKLTDIKRESTVEIVSNTESDRGKGWRFVLSWGSLHLMSGEGGAGTTWGAQTNPATAKFETGVWYHLAGTFDGSVFRVYVDGREVGVSKEGLTITKGRPFVSIGAYVSGYAYGLNGVVSNVKLYNYARTPQEILADAKLAD
jgi:hypothetical protein